MNVARRSPSFGGVIGLTAARRDAVAAVAVVLLALGAAACGGSSQTTSTQSAASQTTTTSSTTSPQRARRHTTRQGSKPQRSTTTTQTTAQTTRTTRTTPPRTTTTRNAPPPAPTTTTTRSRTAPAFTPPVHVVLTGPNHAPVVDADWSYTVTVSDAHGRRLSGTETTQYLFNGAVVGIEKPQNVPFTNGVYHDTIQFPKASLGYPLVVRAVVHTSIGTGHADWPIKVKKP